MNLFTSRGNYGLCNDDRFIIYTKDVYKGWLIPEQITYPSR